MADDNDVSSDQVIDDILKGNTSRRKRASGSLSAAQRRLNLARESIISQFGDPSSEMIKCPVPSYRGPLSLQKLQFGSLESIPSSVRAFEYEPKMILAIDVGERKLGASVLWQKTPAHPALILFKDNINFFVNHPLSVEYLLEIYKEKRLPNGVSKWSDIHSFEAVREAEISSYNSMRQAVLDYSPTAGSQSARTMTSNQLKHAALSHFFDTSAELNYMANGTMNATTFEKIPSDVVMIGRTMRRNMAIYAAFFKAIVGHIDHIFIENQAQLFGEQGKHDQISIEAGLQSVYPEPETKYHVISGGEKMKMYSLTRADVAHLNTTKRWKSPFFFSLGPSSMLTYNTHKLNCPEAKVVLKKYKDFTDPSTLTVAARKTRTLKAKPTASVEPSCTTEEMSCVEHISKKRSRSSGEMLLEDEVFGTDLKSAKKLHLETSFGDPIVLTDEEEEEKNVTIEPKMPLTTPSPSAKPKHRQPQDLTYIKSQFRF